MHARGKSVTLRKILYIPASDIICLSVNINCLLLMNNRPTSSVYGLNKRCLIGAFCRFLFNMIG